MDTSWFKTDLEWLIHADYLEEQGDPKGQQIREIIENNTQAPWNWEWSDWVPRVSSSAATREDALSRPFGRTVLPMTSPRKVIVFPLPSKRMNDMLQNLFGIDSVGVTSGGVARGRVIACGPTTKQPMTIKFRLVLIEWEHDGFSIHDQCFYDPMMAPTPNAYYLTDGEYFDINDLAKATRLFCKRLEKRAECLDSIYREQPCNSKSEPSSVSDTK